MKTFREWLNSIGVILESNLKITASDIPENMIRGQEYSERPFNVVINPNRSEFLGLATQGARGFSDQNGNIYLWQYDNGLHNFVATVINYYYPDTSVELYVPFYVRINPISHDGTRKAQVYFDSWTKGKTPRNQLAQVLQNSPHFQNLNLGYDPIENDLNRKDAPVTAQPNYNQSQSSRRTGNFSYTKIGD